MELFIEGGTTPSQLAIVSLACLSAYLSVIGLWTVADSQQGPWLTLVLANIFALAFIGATL